jgi:transcription-repair coupling factor (superfamily II helicase)
MTIQDLLQLYAKSPQVGALADVLGKKSVKTVFLEGLMCSSAPMAFASLPASVPFLFILQDVDEAGYFYHDMVQLLGEGNVLFFPSGYRRSAKYGQRDAANEILRTEVLSKLSSTTHHLSSKSMVNVNRPLYMVTYPDALEEPVASQRQFSERMLTLQCGQTVDVDQTVEKLRQLGFNEVDYVYEPGQFALRGSILDIYSFSSEWPFRIDFFGDDIETISTFEVESQLSKDKRQIAEIVSELNADREVVSFFSFLPEDAVLVTKNYSKTANFRRIEIGIRTMVQPDVAITFQTSPQPQFHKNFELLQHSLKQSLADGYRLCMLADSKKQLQRLHDIFAEMGTVSGDSDSVNIPFNPIEKTLHAGFIDHDLRLCVFTDHQIFDRFHKYSLRSDKARSGKVALTLKEIQQFEIGDYVVHIDHGIGKFGGLVRMPVTSTPGEGREGAYQEMIKIIYDGGGTIYVSIHSLYKVSKYKSQDGSEPPRLSHLGTGQWERMKERTKQKLKDIARDLIKLYATRRKQRGFSFSADTFMQHELEASFLYEDTPDQLKATNDVKNDMERAQPMDRLVCGDVGFGKTEVAVRAAFKAACDGKQVAVLVPTTVLAYQHYQTFSGRLKDFPVCIEYLSRARSAKQTTAILKDLAEGKIDIIIGTHKLIGKNVKFKDLGLLIIDEEQKFGVSTKEKLRQLKTNVDTLTMSATPIPRTLQFSLVGARDLSIIQTPPPNRYPIQTEIHTFSADIIAEAVDFEMSRNGQVFFVNPRINDLQRIRDLIGRSVPGVRIALAHGQMKPDELERIIFDFQNYDYDVLLSTTIIENGIDIPNANTIIINGAQHFGLSDLHQMRGRVGRGNRKAFCYLLAPPLADLPVESRRRLEALEQFSDLGSGIHIAMQDLDIRGAGNLLGAEQSGFIADLGYETYVKILQQAVVEIRNENPAHTGTNPAVRSSRSTEGLSSNGFDFVSDCSLDSDLELYFPDQYVPSDSERMLLYRELDGLHTDEQVAAYRSRLVDRFGPVPHVGEELMRVVALRRHGKNLGCEKIMLKQGRMTLYFVTQSDSPYYQSEAFDRILSFVAQNPRRCQFREQNGRRSMVIANIPTVEEAVNILRSIAQ